jgi:hypothetical protein
VQSQVAAHVPALAKTIATDLYSTIPPEYGSAFF